MASSSDSAYHCGKSLLDDLDTGLRAKRRWQMAFLALRVVRVMLELPKEMVSRTKKYGDDETGRYSFVTDVDDHEDAGLAEIVREKNSAATQRIFGFVGMVLVLWLPIVVPLLPSFLQSWTTNTSFGIAELACIVGLYTAFMILLVIWGKRIHGYENPFHRYGLD